MELFRGLGYTVPEADREFEARRKWRIVKMTVHGGDPTNPTPAFADGGQSAGGPMLRFYRRNRPSASGLDPEGEDRTPITHVTVLTSPGATWINDRNPKQLPAVARKCDTSQHPATAGETGAVGRDGAADPHGRTERSGVNSSRPGSGRSRGIKFACVHPSGSGRHGQNGEAPGLVPEVLHVTSRPAASDLYDRLRSLVFDCDWAVVGIDGFDEYDILTIL